MSNPKISIIVPVYKVEKVLQRCIESIISQTYTDWELLLIDDGSPDNSGKICDKFALQDYRIKVFHKENGGASSARNLGLNNAIGEFVAFCDSDDYVSKKWLESYHVDFNKDLSIQGFIANNWETKGDEVSVTLNSMSDENSSISELLFHLWQRKNLGYLVCRLFRLSIINEYKLRFDEKIKLREDLLFNNQYIKFIKTFQTHPSACYIYECNFGKYRFLGYNENLYSDKKNYYALNDLQLVGLDDYLDYEAHRYALSIILVVLHGDYCIKVKLSLLNDCRIILKQIKRKNIFTRTTKFMYYALFCFK